MIDLADLSARKRREVISLALQFALADLASDIGTGDLAHAIAARLECPRQASMVSRVLVSLAKAGDARAYKSGETFERYGRTMQRWKWRAACKADAAAIWSV